MIHNKKFTKTKKNGGIVPAVRDERTLFVPIPCGNCIECMKKKARDWQIRLQEDIKTHTGAKMTTLTFSNESIKELHTKIILDNPALSSLKGYELDNKIATVAIRLFNERYRKKYKKALRHWFVTELGHNGTENIHLHGIVWPQCSLEELESLWKYGWIWKYRYINGVKTNYVNGKTISYSTKYITKKDELYKHYKPKVLCSPGIGRNYTNTLNAQMNKFKGEDTRQTYKTETGHKISLPTYWRKKIYDDEEREILWRIAMDKNEAWVCGEKINIANGKDELFKLIHHYRKLNRRLGFGSYHKDEERLQWEETRRQDMFLKRIKDAEKTNTKLSEGEGNHFGFPSNPSLFIGTD